MARAGCRSSSQQRLLRVTLSIAAIMSALAAVHCDDEGDWQLRSGTTVVETAAASRQLLQNVSPDCIMKNCLAEITACQNDTQCAQGLGCSGGCKTDPDDPEVWFICVVQCLYKFSLYNPRSAAFNTCIIKNACTKPPVTGPLRICLPPKGGFSKVKAEDLRGRYNVLAGATKLECETAQFRFGFPKPGYYSYQTYPSYLKPARVIKLPPYKFTGNVDGFSFNAGTLAGLPDVNKYAVLDATAGNKYVLLMYCNQGTNIISGYVLGKDASSIPREVRRRFAKKLRSSVWAAYYDLPLSAFCTVKARKFP